MKKLALILMLCLSGCVLFGAKKLKEPKIKLADIEMREGPLTNALLIVSLSVDNPNDVKLDLDEVAYTVSVQGEALGTGALKDVPVIPAHSQGIVHLPIRVNLTQLLGHALGLITKQPKPYEVKGKVRYGIVSLDFKEGGELIYADGKIKKN